MKIIENKKLLIAIIFAAALVVRLVTIVALETYKFPNEEAFGFGYGDTARYVALGEGFKTSHFLPGTARPSAVSPPGYVYFMAMIFSLFGIYSVASAIILEVFQSLIAAFACVVFYYLGKRFHENVGLLAALAMAFYPPSILFSVMRISPILLVVLLLGIIMLYLFKIQERQKTRDAVICGVLMGVNALMEPTVILFYGAGCIWLFRWSFASRVWAIKSCFIMASLCILCVLPWSIRNYLVFGAFVPIKSSMGAHLLQGNHPFSTSEGATFGPEMKNVFSTEERALLETMDEVQANKFMQSKAIEFIKADPAMFVGRTMNRIYYYWAPVNPYRETPYDRLRILTYGPVFVLGIIGFLLSRRYWRQSSLLLALMLSYPLFYYVTQVTINRYRFAPEVFLIIPACFASLETLRRFGWSGWLSRMGSGESVGTVT
jgi:4-amino-4-deoxy-L-arabinose transferase-like glycosyltransferase